MNTKKIDNTSIQFQKIKKNGRVFLYMRPWYIVPSSLLIRNQLSATKNRALVSNVKIVMKITCAMRYLFGRRFLRLNGAPSASVSRIVSVIAMKYESRKLLAAKLLAATACIQH